MTVFQKIQETISRINCTYVSSVIDQRSHVALTHLDDIANKTYQFISDVRWHESLWIKLTFFLSLSNSFRLDTVNERKKKVSFVCQLFICDWREFAEKKNRQIKKKKIYRKWKGKESEIAKSLIQICRNWMRSAFSIGCFYRSISLSLSAHKLYTQWQVVYILYIDCQPYMSIGIIYTRHILLFFLTVTH